MSSNSQALPHKKLGIHFDADALKADLRTVETMEWVAHVNERNYSGAWDVLPLRCDAKHVDGHPILQGFALEGVTQWQNLPILNQCPAFTNVLNTLQQHMDIYSARLMRLRVGAEIAEHRDAGVSHEAGDVRLHVPIVTNPEVEFLVSRQAAAMKEGELWYINADLPHSVANRGNCDRIHLVIDCAANDWLHGQLA